MIVLCCVVGRERGSGSVDLCFENGEWGMGNGKKEKDNAEKGNGKMGNAEKGGKRKIKSGNLPFQFFFFCFIGIGKNGRKKAGYFYSQHCC